MRIRFADGKLTVLDDKGKVVVGVVHATVSVNADGRSEAMLYVNIDHFEGVDLRRAGDGVREERPISVLGGLADDDGTGFF